LIDDAHDNPRRDSRSGVQREGLTDIHLATKCDTRRLTQSEIAKGIDPRTGRVTQADVGLRCDACCDVRHDAKDVFQALSTNMSQPKHLFQSPLQSRHGNQFNEYQPVVTDFNWTVNKRSAIGPMNRFNTSAKLARTSTTNLGDITASSPNNATKNVPEPDGVKIQLDAQARVCKYQ